MGILYSVLLTFRMLLLSVSTTTRTLHMDILASAWVRAMMRIWGEWLWQFESENTDNDGHAISLGFITVIYSRDPFIDMAMIENQVSKEGASLIYKSQENSQAIASFTAPETTRTSHVICCLTSSMRALQWLVPCSYTPTCCDV